MRKKISRCKGSLLCLTILAVFLTSAFSLAPDLAYGQVIATNASETPFDKHKVLSDSDLVASSTMTVGQIQSFLQTQDSPLAVASIQDKTAAEIIYQAGQKSRINPRVLLVLIELGQGQIAGLPEGSPGALDEQIEQVARLLRAYYDNYTTLGAKFSEPMNVNDGRVKPRNAATAALYSLIPWIGEPKKGEPTTAAGLYQFQRSWMQWFGSRVADAKDIKIEGTCPTITPTPTVQRVTGTLTGPGQIRDWCFMATAGQVFEFSTCPPEGSGTFDTVIEVLTGDGLRTLACNDDAPGCGLLSRLLFTAPSAGQYRIRVSGCCGPRPCAGGGAAAGTFTLGYRTFVAPPCTATVTPTPTFQTIDGSIAPGQFSDYCFTATAGRIYDFTTCDPGSADFDTILEIRDFLGMTLLAVNDDFCDGRSYVSWRATSSGQFRARILGFGSESGDYTLAYRVTPLVPCTPITPADDFQIAGGSVAPGGAVDFCFDARAGVTYEFSTCTPGSADFNTVVEIRTEGGDPIGGVSTFICGLQARVRTTPGAGRFRVRVRSAASDGGSFRLAYRIAPPPRSIEIEPQMSFQTTDGTLIPGGFIDYSVFVYAGEIYEFTLCPPGSAAFPSTIDVLNEAATIALPVVRFACPTGFGQSVFFTPTSDAFIRVRVRNASGTKGSYRLAYQISRCIDIEPEVRFQTAEGMLLSGGSRDYCVIAYAGKTYEFTLCLPGSTAFPSTIDVLNEAGTVALPVVRSACPTGPGQRVLFTPTSDAAVRVRVRNTGGTTGNYRLAYQIFTPPPCTDIEPSDTFRMITDTLPASSSKDYCFHGESQDLFDFTTCPPGASAFPSTITVLDENGLNPLGVVSRTGCPPGQGQAVAFRAPSTGTFRVRVSSGATGGSYTLAHRVTPVAPILIYADDFRHLSPNTYIDAALRALEIRNYVAVYGIPPANPFPQFESLLRSRTWDLVILASDNIPPPISTLDLLNTYVQNGGKLVIHTWAMGRFGLTTHPLWSRLSVRFVREVTSPPPPIFWWVSDHPLFTDPETVPNFTTGLLTLQIQTYGQRVEVLTGGTALGGYTMMPMAQEATLVLSNQDRALFRSFIDAHNDGISEGRPNGVKLWINTINFMLNRE